MKEQSHTSGSVSSMEISEQQLQSTLDNFLEEDEKSSSKSVWNIKTISGLAFIFLSFSYVGHVISTELLGFEALSFVTGFMQIAPYIAGALLGVICLGMLRSKKQKKKMEEKEEMQNQKTRDNLDKFLYADSASGASARSKSWEKDKSFSSKISDSTSGRLKRSRTDKRLFGVCGGLAKHLGISSTVLRLIFVAAFFLGYGSFLLVYIALAVIMPKEPIDWMDDFNN